MNDLLPSAMPAADNVYSRAGLDVAQSFATAARFIGLMTEMDISRDEQRVLHALAQGGYISLIRDENGKVTDLEFFNRGGWRMTNCTIRLFQKLKARRAIKSSGGRPYQITRRGLELVRSEYDNR